MLLTIEYLEINKVNLLLFDFYWIMNNELTAKAQNCYLIYDNIYINNILIIFHDYQTDTSKLIQSVLMLITLDMNSV